MQSSRFTGSLLLVLVLSACGPAADGTNDASGATPPSAQVAETVAPPEPAPVAAPVAPSAKLWFEPAALSTCEKSAVVLVSWDASEVKGLKNVDLKTLRSGGEEGQFARAGRVGSKQTGPWMSAGRVIILRSADDGSELARATVGSLPCE